MAQSGIHAFVGIALSKFLNYEKWLIPSIIFGLLIPDIDIIFTVIGMTDFKSTFLMHSIFFATLTYLVFLSISEITSDKKFETVGKGLSIGILLHITIDALFWFQSIYIFWPLKVDYSIINHSNDFIVNILLALEFLFFRIYGWYLVKRYIEKPASGSWFIKYISRWIKIEFILFILFLLLSYLNVSNYQPLFILMYIPSLIMALISTYILRDIFN